MRPCSTCVHFRRAPYEAKRAGCYHPKLMQGKQKDAFLDEQQVPGDPDALNRNNDCAQWQGQAPAVPLLRRLFSLGA